MDLAKSVDENNVNINSKKILIMSKTSRPIIETKSLGKKVSVADGDLSILSSVD